MPKDIRGSDSAEKRKYERHTGADGLLKFDLNEDYVTNSDLDGDYSGFVEIPVTSVDWNRSFDTNDVQHNGSLSPTITTTGVRFDGSFEYTGQNPNLIQALAFRDGTAANRKQRPIRGTLTIIEHAHDTSENSPDQEQKITFKRCLITDVNRDYPSDDSTTASVDWEAEDMDHEIL